MESASKTATVPAMLKDWGVELDKPKFAMLSVGGYMFAPICSEQRMAYVADKLPSQVLEESRAFFGTEKVWQEFVDAFGSKEARSGYAAREGLSVERITRTVDRDLLRLVGGASESWKREFEGGNPFTGYAIIDKESRKVIGRMAAGSGYKPTNDLDVGPNDHMVSYKAEPWSEEDIKARPTADVRGPAELQIGDAIDTRLPEAKFKEAYRACILAATVLAHTYCGRATQDGVSPRRLTVTLIDPAKCKIHNKLEEAEVRILGEKRKILEELGFKFGGSLYPKELGEIVDKRNYDDHVRDVYVLDLTGVAKTVKTNLLDLVVSHSKI